MSLKLTATSEISDSVSIESWRLVVLESESRKGILMGGRAPATLSIDGGAHSATLEIVWMPSPQRCSRMALRFRSS